MKTAKEFIKSAKGRECTVYEVLNVLALKYNSKFRKLILPKPIRIDKTLNLVVLKYYKGQSYNDLWHKIHGGKLLDMELTKKTSHIIYDLSQIKIDPLLKDKRINQIPFYKFDYRKWKGLFNKNAQELVRMKLLSSTDVSRANQIFKNPFKSKYIFNNGDFYPGNFILQNNKIVLIDWQTWDEDYRANLIDYWENVFAFCYVHMWTNPAWQKEFIRQIHKYFTLEVANFQKAVLIKSFEQTRYRLRPEKTNLALAKSQLKIFKKFLNSKYVADLVKKSRP